MAWMNSISNLPSLRQVRLSRLTIYLEKIHIIKNGEEVKQVVNDCMYVEYQIENVCNSFLFVELSHKKDT